MRRKSNSRSSRKSPITPKMVASCVITFFFFCFCPSYICIFARIIQYGNQSYPPAVPATPLPSQTHTPMPIPPSPTNTSDPTITPTATPTPTESITFNCEPSYPDVCLAMNKGDYDCAGGSGNGPNYVEGPIRVLPPDPFDLDRDNDGIGCEK